MAEAAAHRGRQALRLRVLGLLLGSLFLVWLPFEDTNIMYAIALAAGASLWVALRVLLLKQPKLKQTLLLGSGAGLLVSPLAISLMVFKSSLHGHGFADFALVQVQRTLAFMPWLGLSGLVLGLVFHYLYEDS